MKINRQRKQKPPYRDTKQIILKKSRSLMRNLTFEQAQSLQKRQARLSFRERGALYTGDTARFCAIDGNLSAVFGYCAVFRDNRLRCWFNALDLEQIEAKITMSRKIEEWTAVMDKVFRELFGSRKRKAGLP